MPIESAPRDGRLFLCWVRAAQVGEDDCGSYYEADASEIDFGRWRESELGGYCENMMGRIADLQEVTHWMPLPEPPEAKPGPLTWAKLGAV
jgi:hypothetical protein